jgi:2-polyprenyl-3-methyl-5-hydroxy-6-metoxy-1,4-benzoquinol methylase/Flp pilus assembly protein TadD
MNRKERRAARKQGHVEKPNQNGWACNDLGNMLAAQGRWEEAFHQFERALLLLPDTAAILCNMAGVRALQGRRGEAARLFERALAIEPRQGEIGAPAPDRTRILLNLANLRKDLGQLDQAAKLYERLLALAPDHAEAHNNLGCVLLGLGRGREAAERFQRALTLTPELLDSYADILATLVLANGAVKQGIARAEAAWPGLLPSHELAAELGEIAADPLLQHLLQAAPARDVGLERLLTSLRRHFLSVAEAADTADGGDEITLGFGCALARQCFVNEYIFATTTDELQRSERLVHELSRAQADGRPIPPRWLAAVGCYRPLAALPDAAALVARKWPWQVEDLLAAQVLEPHAEFGLRDDIPRITALADDTSDRVRRQYEENPYPRWVHAVSRRVPISIEEHLRAVFPNVAIATPRGKSGIDILVAGCGTGRHSVEVAQRYRGARVLAVDLSLASLSYAKRKTHAAGLDNVEYAQADLLELHSLRRSFDMIDAAGVLHHLADPIVGWRVLLSLLRPGGVMHVGLYSELARRDIVAARRLISQRGYGPVVEDIRRCREELLRSPLRALARATDFFSTSECRDLLFHVQEHRFTIPQIASFLSEQNLRFLGFELDPRVVRRYAERFSGDRSMTSLDSWHVFEQENPDTFAGMYQFWLQKI